MEGIVFSDFSKELSPIRDLLHPSLFGDGETFFPCLPLIAGALYTFLRVFFYIYWIKFCLKYIRPVVEPFTVNIVQQFYNDPIQIPFVDHDYRLLCDYSVVLTFEYDKFE